LRPRPSTIIILLFLILAPFFILFIYHSRDNPLVVEIILGSIIFSLLLGIISALSQEYIEKQFRGKRTKLFIVATCLLLFLIALLVVAANVPSQMKEQISVIYLIDSNTVNFPSGLTFNDSRTSGCYWDARHIFDQFKNKDTEEVKKVLDAFRTNAIPAGSAFLDCIHDLTVYLVAYYLGNHFTTGDIEEPLHLGESRNWLGWPHQEIEGKSLTLNDIDGGLDQNHFYGLVGILGRDLSNLKIRVPKKTKVSLTNFSRWHSQYVIESKKYCKITITIRNRIHSDNFAILPWTQFGPYSTRSNRGYYRFRRIDTVIYYDATFDKLRYGFPAMQHYKRWANDLLEMLKSKFGWGSPILANPSEVRRYFEFSSRQQNSNKPMGP